VFNAAHGEGMDLNGEFGDDFFGVPAPITEAASTNTGTGAVAAAVADIGQLQATSYRLSYDGASYALIRTDTGAAVTTTGTGAAGDPLLADGLSLVISGAPAAGDEFVIQPLEHVGAGLSTLLDDPSAIAVAAPTRTAADVGNAGSATISAGAIIDVADPNLLAAATIEFIDASTYSINGAGSFAYTSGADIDVNGTRVQISGVPVAGDQFTIQSNAGGSGDNRNAFNILEQLATGLFDGGATSLQARVSQLVTEVGIQTASANNQRDAQTALLAEIESNIDSVRGVNLDEEAADLLRHEQLYQAAAQTMAVAGSLFETLIAALRR
jgi:flagellar hook-associated protein 1 FlgK